MANTKPIIVLIHGGWHIPSTYSKFISSLRSAGFAVHVPRLPSMNEAHPPDADLVTDTAMIRAFVKGIVDAGRLVIAIMHSYGGQVGTNALYGLGVNSRTQRGLPGGVTHLIYMCAFALLEGCSMIGKVKEYSHELFLTSAFDFADDGSCVSRDPKAFLIGPGVDDSEAEAYVASMVRWNGKSMYQTISHCAWRDMPITYIYTSQDMTIPLDHQKSMVERIRAEGQVVHTVELTTGHCPNLTMTQDVVGIVKSVTAG